MDIVFQYPPELMQLLIDTIPRLCRSKKDVLLFFRGAGVGKAFTQDLQAQLDTSPEVAKKHTMTRVVLERLNARGEACLPQRREILKRVVEFEDFSTCWPEDQLKATGLVAQIRHVVNVKDSFTRMNQERAAESRERRQAAEAKQKALEQKRQALQALKDELFALFSGDDPWARGKSLESLLNRLFRASDILVRESFVLSGDESKRVVEQIDGVVDIDAQLYLVEVKWWDVRLGPGDIAQHQVRVFNRGQARGIFISATGYTDAATQACRESLHRAPFVLCELEEIVRALEIEMALADLFRKKIEAAIVEKQPLKKLF